MELQSYSRFDKVSVILNNIRYFLFASIGKFEENIKSLSKSLFIHTICNASWDRMTGGLSWILDSVDTGRISVQDSQNITQY